MKLYSEEPLFVKFSAKSEDWTEWDRIVVPNGKYHVQAPMQHRLVLKQATLMMYPVIDADGAVGGDAHSSTGVVTADPKRLYTDMKLADLTKLYDCGCVPHEQLYLEATDAQTLHTQRDDVRGNGSSVSYDKDGKMVLRPRVTDTERAVNGMRFAQLNMAHRADPSTAQIEQKTATSAEPPVDVVDAKRDMNPRWHVQYPDDCACFDLSQMDTNMIVLRVVDAEGHSLRDLCQLKAFPTGYRLTLTCQFAYQKYAQDVEQPQHPRGGLTGYYKSAISGQQGI